MNNETLLLQRIDRQNDIINLLQKENACFRQIIQSYLLDDVAATQSELALIKALVEESFLNNFFVSKSEGNSGSNSSLADLHEGNSKNNTFLRDNGEGNSGSYSFQRNNAEGNSGSNSFQRDNSKGNNQEYTAALAARMRPFMKYAMQQSLINTALILSHLHSDAATPLSTLRKLTGLSEDGMAKRIMALKKAGLIIRQSAPMRFVLTEKAKALL